MKINHLGELLQQELQDIYDAEKQLVKALPKMAKAASSKELRNAISEHLEATKGQVQRLEQVFETLGAKVKSKPCAAMKGLISEGGEVLERESADELKDLALIAAAQRVEHYEIAAYGSARAFAEQLGEDEVVKLLQETLDEEKEADKKLTQISESLLEIAFQQAEGTEEEAGAARRKTKRSMGA